MSLVSGMELVVLCKMYARGGYEYQVRRTCAIERGSALFYPIRSLRSAQWTLAALGIDKLEWVYASRYCSAYMFDSKVFTVFLHCAPLLHCVCMNCGGVYMCLALFPVILLLLVKIYIIYCMRSICYFNSDERPEAWAWRCNYTCRPIA